MITIQNLDSGYGKLRVLKGVSMHVDAGEIVTIIGANGAGKTTLLNTIAGLVRPVNGKIIFNQQDLSLFKAHQIVALGCSLVPEGRQVFATMSVEENLVLGGHVCSKKHGRSTAAGELERQYALFPVLKERRGQLAGTLSGGEQQMLAMARALMARPTLIMMDEPSTGLAPLIVMEIFRIVQKMRDEGNTVLLVEQNARAALGIADRGYVLETGKIVLQGPAAELIEDGEVKRAYLGRDYETITDR